MTSNSVTSGILISNKMGHEEKTKEQNDQAAKYASNP
jgi:hypothetical protein